MSLDILAKATGSGAASDSFGRLRTSDPQTLFDSQSQYDNNPLLWEEYTTGSGSAAHNANKAAVDLTVTTASGDVAGRQTRQYHRYQPGKSQLIYTTFVMGAGQANTSQRVGYFDDDNGIFLELSGTTLQVVRRSSTSGSAVDTAVTQANWNISTLPDLDITKSQIFVIDLEWLGVGSVRCGFVIDGAVFYVHQFQNSNVLDSVYMTTANLPVRFEVENTGLAAAGLTFQTICASVISEGGFESERGIPFCASNEITTRAVTTALPIISIRPKATFNSVVNRGSIILQAIEAYADTNAAYIQIVYNGTLTGASFASVDTNSIVEFDVAASAISGGQVVNAFFIQAGGLGNQASPGTSGLGVLSRLPLTLDKAGANPINISVVATSFSGTSNVSASMFWQELR